MSFCQGFIRQSTLIVAVNGDSPAATSDVYSGPDVSRRGAGAARVTYRWLQKRRRPPLLLKGGTLVDRLRADGVEIYAIGLGGEVDADLLARLAGSATRYFGAPDADDLEAIYRRIAGSIPCAGGGSSAQGRRDPWRTDSRGESATIMIPWPP